MNQERVLTTLDSLPYRIEHHRENGDWVACIPTLGEKLFRGVAETKEEATAILADIFNDLMAWLVENGHQIPPPAEADRKAKRELKPKESNLGLQCIISTRHDVARDIQPAP
jgi:hypothetical protein